MESGQLLLQYVLTLVQYHLCSLIKRKGELARLWVRNEGTFEVNGGCFTCIVDKFQLDGPVPIRAGN